MFAIDLLRKKLARWCVTTKSEMEKCEKFKTNLDKVMELDLYTVKNLQDYYMNLTGTPEIDYAEMPLLSCVRADDM